jgi:hypothetical protein
LTSSIEGHKTPEVNYNPDEAKRTRRLLLTGTEVVTMADEDTVVLTPEEKENILKDSPEEQKQDEEEDED